MKITRGEASNLIEKLTRENPARQNRLMYKETFVPYENKDSIFDWFIVKTDKPGLEESYVTSVQLPDNFCYVEVTQNILGKFESRFIKTGLL